MLNRRYFMTSVGALIVAGPALADQLSDAKADIAKYAGRVTT